MCGDIIFERMLYKNCQRRLFRQYFPRNFIKLKRSYAGKTMDIVNVIAIILVTVLFLYGYFKSSYGYWKSRGVPCDKPSIPYGNINGIDKIYQNYEIIKKMYDKYKPTGVKLCGIYYFIRPVAIILDLELIKQILIKDFHKFIDRNVYNTKVDDPISTYSFSMDGDRWQKLCTKLQPDKMKFIFPTVLHVGERFKDCLIDAIGKQSTADRMNGLEIKEWCARFIADVIGTSVFGIECNTLKDENADFRQICNKMASNERQSPLSVALLDGFKNCGRRLGVNDIPAEEVSEFITKSVIETMEYRELNGIQRNDFMDILMTLKNDEDKEKAHIFNEIAAQTFVFYAAGFNSSSTALTFCLYELAIQFDVQSKARKAINEAYRKFNGQLTYEMVTDLPYIDQILEGKKTLNFLFAKSFHLTCV